ncbi:MAG: hypothetical protein AAF628_24185 [Planctomycetota bacterium]
MKRHAITPLLALPVLFGATSCQSIDWHDPPAARQELAEYGAERQREWDELKALKGHVTWIGDDPVTFDFPEAGQVTVRRWSLDGGPGWESLRARFTYENTTDKFMERVRVVLYVMDEHGQRVAASRVRLTHPWGWPLRPGSMFSDEIQAPTWGAHRGEDWHWEIDLEVTPQGDPTGSATLAAAY